MLQVFQILCSLCCHCKQREERRQMRVDDGSVVRVRLSQSLPRSLEIVVEDGVML